MDLHHSNSSRSLKTWGNSSDIDLKHAFELRLYIIRPDFESIQKFIPVERDVHLNMSWSMHTTVFDKMASMEIK